MVPDFIDIHYKDFHWFTFNVADIFISFGIILYMCKNLFLKIEMAKKNLLIIIFIIFTACNSFKEAGQVLRNEKTQNTDEFLIKNPLVLPQIMKIYLNLVRLNKTSKVRKKN